MTFSDLCCASLVIAIVAGCIWLIIESRTAVEIPEDE